MALKTDFKDIITKYSSDAVANTYWREIVQAYSQKDRYYHNLSHLENLYNELLSVKDSITSWDNMVISLCYHDIIYNASSKNNEEKSAALCSERLTAINYPKTKVKHCSNIIIATKQHSYTGDTDTDLFTDADLSILGKPWPVYEAYYRAVRKEYVIYPDFLYKPGRKKALKHFLDMEHIFKTPYFSATYENSARKNLHQEIMLL